MLDTDICIGFQRGGAVRLIERVLALTTGEAVLSFVTYAELRLGAEKSVFPARALAALDVVTSAFEVELPSLDVAHEYASIRGYLERQGQTIGGNDIWIAAHARALRLTLVTGNEREFRRVPGLAVENWAA